MCNPWFALSRFRAMLVMTAMIVTVPVVSATGSDEDNEGRLLANVRQLTFEGKRAGEGYFSSDGKQMVFQPNTPSLSAMEPEITVDDLRTHVTFLASEELEGRRTGTRGERLATAYVASVFEGLGLRPAGDDWTFFQEFEFTAGVSLGEINRLTLHRGDGDRAYEADTDWRPLAYSVTGPIEAAPIVFAGYGIVAPASEEEEEYDSYVHLDVSGKWVLAFRYMPENITPERRQHLSTHSSLRFKAMTARDLGAKGIIFVSGPNSKVKRQLIRLAFDASLGGTSVAAISITDEAAQELLDLAGKDLQALQDSLDSGDLVAGFALGEATLSATLDIQQEKRWGRNALARMVAADAPGNAVVMGAHIDHLGKGPTSASLAHDSEGDQIHYGADDNASGVAGLLEIAQYLAELRTKGDLRLKRDILFAAWSGEELGLLGAEHFVGNFPGKGQDDSLRPEIAAYLNMDMIGRMREKTIIQGVETSSLWPQEVERRNVPVGLPLTLQKDIYIPSDSTAFYLRGVPFLNAFTGAHDDYHTPQDTAERLNYEGMEKIARFMALVARSLATRDEPPDFIEAEDQEDLSMRANLRAYLGTIPDYANTDVFGLKLTGVKKGGPADDAGLRGGDLIVELAGRKIENIYDYTYAIEAMKIGQEVEVSVLRGDERITLRIIPGSRE